MALSGAQMEEAANYMALFSLMDKRGASAERQITNDDAIVVRHNNVVISPCHLLPGAGGL